MGSEIITSLQNPRVKEVVRMRRGRGRSERILIDGRREIRRALEGGVHIGEVFYCGPLLGGDDEIQILRPARQRGAELTEVSESVLAKISYGDRVEGMLAVAARPQRSLSDLHLSSCPLVATVEGLEKPGNLGAILRSADAAGVEAVLVVDAVTDAYGPNVIRSSLGTIFWVPVVEVSAGEALEWLLGRRMLIVAADPSAGSLYTGVDFSGPVAVVLGNEAGGLSGAWAREEVIRARIPMIGRADSLNVSITAALFFYEALRQRGTGDGE
ncbi:MAG: TrmH family RNA methyltransferase [Dehalococcoidia bacterium]